MGRSRDDVYASEHDVVPDDRKHAAGHWINLYRVRVAAIHRACGELLALTQPDQVHGTRKTYQQGCTCRPCRSAEAQYRQALRTLKAHGKQPLGSLVAANLTWRQIEALRIEGFSYPEIAQRIGLRWPQLRLHPEVIRLKSALKIQRLYRQYMI